MRLSITTAVFFSLLAICTPVRAQETRPAAKVEAAAQELLKQVREAYGKLKSLELKGTLSLVLDDEGGKETRETTFIATFLSPNKFRQEMKGQPLLGCDGKKVYVYSDYSRSYVQADVADERFVFDKLPTEVGAVLPSQNISLAMALSKDPVAELMETASEIKAAAPREIDGKSFPALSLKLREDGDELVLLIDPQTKLVRRSIEDLRPSMAKRGRPDLKLATLTVDYTSTKTDAPAAETAFAWSVPEGAKDLVAARAEARSRIASILDDNPANALVGKPAPDFSLEDLNGKMVKLSDVKGSVVVLDFFATWCGPCVVSLPHTDQLYQDLGQSGLKVFAVDQNEPKDKVAKFTADKKLSMPVLLDADGKVGRQYMVTGIPQLVVIGKDGQVKKVEVGYNPAHGEELRRFISEQLKTVAAPAAAAKGEQARP
jgi:peroxiredoxin/outer membrane lipoprotein-sorting protein